MDPPRDRRGAPGTVPEGGYVTLNGDGSPGEVQSWGVGRV